MQVPAQAQAPLSNQGQYPATGAPPLSLDQTTTFTLNVEQRISNQPYYAQDQKTVTVATPKPEIALFTGTVETVGSQLALVLNWETLYAKFCTISGDPNQLKPSSTDSSYKIFPSLQRPLRSSYTLSAYNEAGEAMSTLSLEWSQLQRLPVGQSPSDIAVTPDGSRAYTTNAYGASVSALDTSGAAARVIGQPVPLVKGPSGLVVYPDGKRAYVIDRTAYILTTLDLTVSPIVVIGAAAPLGQNPVGIAITPDGARATWA